MNHSICEHCKQKSGCDRVIYDCPIADFKGKSYQFIDESGYKFNGQFKSEENARRFADYGGFTLEGRV